MAASKLPTACIFTLEQDIEQISTAKSTLFRSCIPLGLLGILRNLTGSGKYKLTDVMPLHLNLRSKTRENYNSKSYLYPRLRGATFHCDASEHYATKPEVEESKF